MMREGVVGEREKQCNYRPPAVHIGPPTTRYTVARDARMVWPSTPPLLRAIGR